MKSRFRRVFSSRGSNSSADMSQSQPDSSQHRERVPDIREHQEVSRTRTMVQLNLFGRATFSASSPSASAMNVNPDCERSESLPALNDSVERTRAPKRKAPEGPRGRAKSVRVTKETGVSLQGRVKQFENEGLKVSAGELFCSACLQVLPNICESIKRHIATSKHKERLVKLEKSKAADEQTSYDLADFFANNNDLNGVCADPFE